MSTLVLKVLAFPIVDVAKTTAVRDPTMYREDDYDNGAIRVAGMVAGRPPGRLSLIHHDDHSSRQVV